MSTTRDPRTLEGTIHFARRGARKELVSGPTPVAPPPGRTPRIARLMALAIRVDGLIADGSVPNQAAVARLGRVTRAQVSQILSLLHLAPDLQEAVLFLPRVETGRSPIRLLDLLPIARMPDWRTQRQMWRELTAARGAEVESE